MHDVDALVAFEATAASADSLAPLTRQAGVVDAELVHALYLATPSYFDAISIPVSSLDEVRTELEAAEGDARRHLELVLGDPGWRWPGLGRDPLSDRPIVGYLDYKVDYPGPGDATVNLLLIHGSLQAQGLGAKVITDLERRLVGSVRRLLASIYGRNPSTRRFWEQLGYAFAMDARPVLEWYAKDLRT